MLRNQKELDWKGAQTLGDRGKPFPYLSPPKSDKEGGSLINPLKNKKDRPITQEGLSMTLDTTIPTG